MLDGLNDKQREAVAPLENYLFWQVLVVVKRSVGASYRLVT
ncbi:hypothetical protein O9993_15025 [Vibrio lentus]|nr:hypothetical protein [Vibrio lentus]